MTELPEPLTPAEADLGDFRFMPLEVERLRTSRQWLLAKKNPEIGFYSINLWIAAWHERPAGSLEDDDDMLAELAMCSRRRWNRVRADVLRGWVKCRDGRLYHPVVCEKVREVWQEKLEHREKRSKFRELQREKGRKSAQARLKNKEKSEPGESFGSTGVEPNKGQGQGQVREESESLAAASSLDAARARDPAAAAAAEDQFHQTGERVLALCGNPSLLNYGRVRAWLAQGCDPDLDIIPAVRAVIERERRANPQWMPRSLVYFDGAVADAKAARTKPLREPTPANVNAPPAAPPVPRRPVIGSAEYRRFRREHMGLDLDDYLARRAKGGAP